MEVPLIMNKITYYIRCVISILLVAQLALGVLCIILCELYKIPLNDKLEFACLSSSLIFMFWYWIDHFLFEGKNGK